jgi:hypothetical protein
MTITRKNKAALILYILIISLVMVLCCSPAISLAQGNSVGNSNGSQVEAETSQEQDKVQDRDQDKVQDPATQDESDSKQDRDQTQDQDRLHTTLTDGGATVPQQDQVIYDDHQVIQVRAQNPIATSEQLEAVIIQTRNQLQEQEKNVGQSVRNIHHTQNKVQVAATALASSSDMLGPLGPAVSRIAIDYKTSVSMTVAAEERIHNRSLINSFLFGGDDDAVADLDLQYGQHQLRIQELKRLVDAWDGDPTTKDLLREQIQTMEKEQMRLRQIADEESASRGLFDYLLFWRD